MLIFKTRFVRANIYKSKLLLLFVWELFFTMNKFPGKQHSYHTAVVRCLGEEKKTPKHAFKTRSSTKPASQTASHTDNQLTKSLLINFYHFLNIWRPALSFQSLRYEMTHPATESQKSSPAADAVEMSRFSNSTSRFFWFMESLESVPSMRHGLYLKTNEKRCIACLKIIINNKIINKLTEDSVRLLQC